MQGSPSAATVTKSSISAARSKLGFEPLKALHEHVCMPLVDPIRQPHAFYAGLRLVAIDGSDTGAQLLWCCASNRPLPVVKELENGSYLLSSTLTERKCLIHMEVDQKVQTTNGVWRGWLGLVRGC
jgi:hypothetical protein